MANQQHIQWLLEGVEAWNKRRKNETFVPDFSRVDLDEAFRHAWRLDPRGPIMLRYADLSFSNLSDTWISDVVLAEANLWKANLSGARFLDANLIGCTLVRANLNQAELRDALLTGAQLWGATLTDARLSGADLRDADLSSAILTRTDLVGANLNGTNLMEAEPWHAVIFPSASDLDFPFHLSSEPADTASPDQFEDVSDTVNTVGELLDIIQDIKSRYSSYREELVVYFRGESHCGWPLSPSLVRHIPNPRAPLLQWSEEQPLSIERDPGTLSLSYNIGYDENPFEVPPGFDDWPFERETTLQSVEQRMLTDLSARRPENFSGAATALSRWVLAQHHGLKTRFLDITSNPLVAMFHACANERRSDARLHIFVVPRSLVKTFTSDVVSIIANFARLDRYHQQVLLGKKYQAMGKRRVSSADHKIAMRQLYQSIKQEKPYFEELIDPRDFYRVFAVEPQQASERIRAQSGAFLVSAFHPRFERQEILNWNPSIPVYAHYPLTIPESKKARVVEDLRVAGVSGETLFPGLDSTASAITERYEERVRASLKQFGLRVGTS